MSWFGEHLTNLTSKISDLTKEVLIDPTTNVLKEDNVINSSEIPSEDILCEDKDLINKKLKDENEQLKNNLVELNDQHEEILKELLLVKSRLEKDNKNLRVQLKEKDDTFKHIQANICVLDNINCLNDSNLINMDNLISIVSNLNALSFLSYFQNQCNVNVCYDILNKLEHLKHLIEENYENVDAKLCCDTVIPKLDIFITYFKIMCEHSNEAIPFLKEISTLFMSKFYSSSNENGPTSDHNTDTHSNKLYFKVCDKQFLNTCSQTDDNVFLCEDAKCTQTDIDLPSLSETLLRLDTSLSEINQLKRKIEKLENQNSLISSSSQTESFICDECNSNSNYLLKIGELELQNEQLNEKINKLVVQLDEKKILSQTVYNSVLVQTENAFREIESSYCQTDNFSCDECINNLSHLLKIDELQLENKSMIEQINVLKNQLNERNFNSQKKVHSVLVQTENIHEHLESYSQTDNYSCENCVNKSEYLTLISQVDEFQTENVTLNEKLNSLMSEVELLKLNQKPEIHVNSVSVQTLTSYVCIDVCSQTDFVCKDCHNFRLSIDNLQNKNVNLNQTVQSLETEIEELKFSLQKFKVNTASFSSQTSVSSTINNSSQTNDFICNECIINNLNHVQEVNTLQHENSRLMTNVNELQLQIKELKVNQNFKPNVHSIPTQTAAIGSYNDSYCQTDKFNCQECFNNSNYAQTIKSLENYNSSLTEKLNEIETELQTFKQKKDNINSSTQTTSSCRCSELESMLRQKGRQIEMLHEQLILVPKDLELDLQKKLMLIHKLENDFNSQQDNAFNAQRDENLRLKEAILSLVELANELRQKYSTCGDFQQNCPSFSGESIHLSNEEISARTLEQQLTMPVSDNDKLLLQQQLKAVNLEKNQLLCMLNEKSQECSSLKSEVHRLTNIIVKEKQALFKLQQDNKDLKNNKENDTDIDLTKEALKNLSYLVRDKDKEIEELKQKIKSLSSHLQTTESSSNYFQNLMEEREDLLVKIKSFEADQERIKKSYNAKDLKCRNQQMEIKKLTTELTAANEKIESFENQRQMISVQYEEKQKLLLSVQNELVTLKQNYSEISSQYKKLSEMMSELLLNSNSDSIATLSTKLSEINHLRKEVKEKTESILEKDKLIKDYLESIKSYKSALDEIKKHFSEQSSKIIHLENLLAEESSKTIKERSEKEKALKELSDKINESNFLCDLNDRLNIAVKENESLIKLLGDKTNSSTTNDNVINPESSESYYLPNKNDIDEKQSYRQDNISPLEDQLKEENKTLKQEKEKLKETEEHLKKELDRLRKHMLQIEENYTNEALKAEERERQLRMQLTELEKSAKLSSSAVADVSHLATTQVSSLQEELALVTHQRDSALSQLSDLEDKVQLYSTSSNNLQLVLEKRQRDYEQRLKETDNKWLEEIKKVQLKYEDAQKLIQQKQEQLEESCQAIAAASRLSELLDTKEEIISNLKNQLLKMENNLKSAHHEIDSLKNNPDGKVDRVIMKSLVLGYFSTPPTQKSEVVRLLARVLDFNQEEMQKAGIIVSRSNKAVEPRGLFSSILGRLPSIGANENNFSTNSTISEPSFTTLFVKFLENESRPVVPLPLPVEKLAEEQQVSNFQRRSSNTKGSPNKSPLLLNIDAAFPTFATLPAVDYNNSSAILKEVLE